MPDHDKLTVYKANDATIVRSCGTCAHATFPSPQASWGECAESTYDHAKHGTRQLPAHVLLVCAKWTVAHDLPRRRELGDYAALIPRGRT